MQWYYAVNNERQGPITEAEFEKFVAEGRIKPETLVWRMGMTEWKPYSAVAAPAPVAPSAAGAAASAEETEVCAVSGKRYPKREMIQYEGKWISGEHRDEFFQRLREGVTQPGTFVYGNFWPRFAAKFLDGLILGMAGMLINVALGLVLLGTANYFTGVATAARSAAMAFQIVSNLLGIGLGLAYSMFFISRYSATPGKMALGLKLVRSDGSPLSIGRIIGRHFAEWLSSLTLLIGYIIAAFDEERRALHDRICDTRVIKVK
jgi:uncharacterized RDD family membrane protein YckC